tara:strand:+ start:218 stop:481 length:264 start_codon:yes stop_codon:yes gene_type:complete
MSPVRNIGRGTIRWGPNWPSPNISSIDCFFEPCNNVPATQLMPKAVIIDYCDTFDLDGNGDIMPEVSPLASGHFEIDANGDIMPEAP